MNEAVDILLHQLLSMRSQIEALLYTAELLKKSDGQGSSEGDLLKKIRTFGGEHPLERPND